MHLDWGDKRLSGVLVDMDVHQDHLAFVTSGHQLGGVRGPCQGRHFGLVGEGRAEDGHAGVLLVFGRQTFGRTIRLTSGWTFRRPSPVGAIQTASGLPWGWG